MDGLAESLLVVLIADEICHLVPYIVSLDPNWYGFIVPGWDF